MKENWVVLLAAGLYVAFLAYVGGAMSVVGVTNEMPFGVVEFWLNRYQGFAAGGLALAAVAAAYFQVYEQRRQARKLLAVQFAPALQSTQFAHDIALETVQELDKSENVDWLSPLPIVGQAAIAIVNDHSNAAVREAFDLLAKGVESFNSGRQVQRAALAGDVRRAATLVVDLSIATRNGLYIQINA